MSILRGLVCMIRRSIQGSRVERKLIMEAGMMHSSLFEILRSRKYGS